MRERMKSVRSNVVELLNEKKPLSVITLNDLCEQLAPANRNTIRTALHAVSIGTPVSERNTPSVFYAIRLNLAQQEVFLTLPGVPSSDLRKDILSTEKTNGIISRLQSKYGKEVIDYWVLSAQHRSVVQAACGMRQAKKRDQNACLLCMHEGRISDKPVSACHLVSRRTLFWSALDDVERMKGSLFTVEAVEMLRSRLKDNELHSSSKYIVTLCPEHDNYLQEVLSGSIVRGNKLVELPLFATASKA